MSSFPTPITNLKLRISTGSSNDVEIFEESIPPSAISGINGIHVINNPSLIGASGAFNTKPHGTIFNSAIVTTYDDINLVPGEIIITPGNSNFVPNPIQANLSLAPLPELNTLSSSFSLNDYITKNSPAPLSFSSNNTSVITVSSAGLVTIQGVGQATITITQPASSDNVYTAATPVSRVVDVIPPPSLTWSNITKSLSIKAFPLIGDLAPSSNIPLSYGNIWNFLGGDIDGEVANDRSGYSNSLSADGTIVAIGAVYNNGVNGTYSGHVRVYKYDVTKTTAVTDQTSPDYGPVGWRRLGQDIDGEAAGDFSGYSVSLSADGTILAIGASENNANGSYSGHVRVYKYDVTKTNAVTDQTSPDYGPVGWRRLGQDIDGEATNDYSGYSVSLSADGTIVAIGASENNANGSYSGHVRVYKYDVTKTTAVTDQSSPDFGPVGWRRLGKDIDGEAAGDFSGVSVSLSTDGTIVAIGARSNNANGIDSGHVRVYKYDVTKTTAVTDQTSPDYGSVGWRRLGHDIDGEAASDNSGYSVSLSADGTIVAIGAYGNDANGNNSGHVRVYKYDVTKTTAVTDQSSPDYGPVGWRRLGKDIDGEAAGDKSGYSVSLSADGTILAIGASENNANGSYSGDVRVYKYDVTKTTDVTDQSSPDYGPIGWRRLGQDIDGEAASDYSGVSVSLSADGTIVAIGAYQNDGNGSNSGNVRVYKIDSFGNFTYTSNTPAVADVYGNIVLLRSTGETTLTATQSATSSYISRTVNATLTVSTPPPPPSSLVAHYPFDSDGNDTSTNDNHLTNNNTVTFNTVDYRQGSGAASFNGSNYFEIANDGKFSPDNFTVACWIKPVSSAGDYQSIATCRTGYSPNLSGWMIYIHPDNNLQFWTGNGSSWSGGGQNLFSGFGNLNRWVHLAFTFNKATGSLVMYVDGTLTTTVSRSYANTTVNSLRIGAGATEQNAQFFLRNGTLLDDFRFYHGVLSASEISDIYSN
jgi:hypothetical protein